MSTYLQLCQQVRQEIGETGNGPTTVVGQTGIDKKIIDWTAEADFAIQSLWFDWRFLWSEFTHNTLLNTQAVAAPTTPPLGVWDLDSFWAGYGTANSRHLVYVDYKKYRDTMGFGTVTANTNVTHFSVKPDGSLILYPKPSAGQVVTAEYYRSPLKMTANTDTPLIPAQYERCIVARAKMYYAEEEEVPELYEKAATEYAEQLARLESHQLADRHDNAFRSQANSMVVISE